MYTISKCCALFVTASTDSDVFVATHHVLREKNNKYIYRETCLSASMHRKHSGCPATAYTSKYWICFSNMIKMG